jgi:DNA-binding GntR family transcriptional regulator
MANTSYQHHHPQPRINKLTSLSDQVYEHLRLAIIGAELQPGEKLVELEIAAQMGTSQGPVREALQRLEHDGLVERRARSATYVTTSSNDEMFEIFSVRNVIEGFAIRRTAQIITPAQCDELEALIREMVSAGSRNEIMAVAEDDMQFHRRIVEWSRSPNLLRVWLPLAAQTQRFIVQSHPIYFPNYIEVGTRHQAIVDVLRQQAGDQAAKVMQEHIMRIWSKINP